VWACGVGKVNVESRALASLLPPLAVWSTRQGHVFNANNVKLKRGDAMWTVALTGSGRDVLDWKPARCTIRKRNPVHIYFANYSRLLMESL